MLIFTQCLRVCLALDPCDLRVSFEKLAVLVKERLGEDERSSQVFVFTNKRRNRVKMLYWDGTGLWILTKKLDSQNHTRSPRQPLCWRTAGRGGIVGPVALSIIDS